MDKELLFVLRHYRMGSFNPDAALLRMKEKAGREISLRTPLWRRWVAAASVALVLLVGAYAAYEIGYREVPATTEEAAPVAHTARQFHYDHTPLAEVLRDLGQYYGVSLTASHPDKLLTADFEAFRTGETAADEAALGEIISMIESVLDEKIGKQALK